MKKYIRPQINIFTIKGLFIEDLPNYNKKLHDRYLYVIHIILSQHFKQKKNNITEGIPLNFDLLSKIFGDRKKTENILEFLIENDIIIKTMNYVSGHHSNHYGITSNFDISRGIIYDKLIIANKNKYKNKFNKMNELENYQYQIYLKHLQLNNEKLNAVISNEENINKKYHLIAYQDMINDKEWFYNTSSTNRTFHPVNCMSKKIRECCNFSIEFDCKNSQPLLLQKLYEKTKNNSNIIINTYLLEEFHKTLNINTKYNYLVSNGLFWNFLCDELNEDKEIVKKKVLKYLFGKSEYAEIKIYNLFVKYFPEIVEFIEEYKRKDHTKLSKDLQMMESKIWIDGISTKLMNLKYEFFNVHDSVLLIGELTTEQIKAVETLIYDEFKNNDINECKISKTIRN